MASQQKFGSESQMLQTSPREITREKKQQLLRAQISALPSLQQPRSPLDTSQTMLSIFKKTTLSKEKKVNTAKPLQGCCICHMGGFSDEPLAIRELHEVFKCFDTVVKMTRVKK